MNEQERWGEPLRLWKVPKAHSTEGTFPGEAVSHCGESATECSRNGLTLQTLCWHTVVMGWNTSSWQQMHRKVSSTLLRNNWNWGGSEKGA